MIGGVEAGGPADIEQVLARKWAARLQPPYPLVEPPDHTAWMAVEGGFQVRHLAAQLHGRVPVAREARHLQGKDPPGQGGACHPGRQSCSHSDRRIGAPLAEPADDAPKFVGLGLGGGLSQPLQLPLEGGDLPLQLAQRRRRPPTQHHRVAQRGGGRDEIAVGDREVPHFGAGGAHLGLRPAPDGSPIERAIE